MPFAAQGLIDKGFRVVPIPEREKAPKLDSWQSLSISRDTVNTYFDKGCNVGIILGHNGITDVDLDCDEAIRIAPLFLPETGAIFGRQSARASHWLYTCDPVPLSETFKDAKRGQSKGAMIVEVRALTKADKSIGRQTVAPGSIHPSGERIEWETGFNGLPSAVKPKHLFTASSRIGAAVLLARYCPGEHGGRNAYFMAVDGMLLRAGWSYGDVFKLRRAIWIILFGKNLEERQCKAEFDHSVSEFENEKPVTAITRLKETIDPSVVNMVTKWLELRPASEVMREKQVAGARANLSVPAQLKPAWATEATKKRDGFSVMPSLATAILMLESAPDFHASLAYNSFTGGVTWVRDVQLFGGVVIEAGSKLREEDASNIRNHAERCMNIIFDRNTVEEAIMTVAKRQSSHPVRNYLNELTWDGIKRLDTWLIDYMGVEDTLYSRAVSRKFMISAVARILNGSSEGCKVDTCLILESPSQGLKKSFGVSKLVPNRAWFSESFDGDVTAKDTMLGLRGKWLIEIPEIDKLFRQETSDIKAFLSKQVDSYRAPYARVSQDNPRECVFVGTTNRSDYLRDETGNRRFWPVKITGLNTAAIERDRDQLWAEAVSLYRANTPWWITDNEHEVLSMAVEQQSARLFEHPWQSRIEDHLSKCGGEITMGDVFAGLGIPIANMRGNDARTIAACLTVAGWEKVRQPSGARAWCYRPKNRPRQEAIAF